MKGRTRNIVKGQTSVKNVVSPSGCLSWAVARRARIMESIPETDTIGHVFDTHKENSVNKIMYHWCKLDLGFSMLDSENCEIEVTSLY